MKKITISKVIKAHNKAHLSLAHPQLAMQFKDNS